MSEISEPKRRRRMQICASNQLARRHDMMKKLKENGWVVEVEECLDQCTRCSTCAFALVCGRFLFASDPHEFIRQLQ